MKHKLHLCLITGLLLSRGASFAQGVEATPAPTDANGSRVAGEVETERIIVTGSNIPTANEVGPNPILNITRDIIEKSGERTAAELLRSQPVANANGVPTSNNGNGQNGPPGASSISLRGFDASATLVLLDGRRLAPYPVGTGSLGTQSFIDLNSIPSAAVENIEILKDGASTTYGADAVAGVVNIKLRHDFKGAEISIGYGNTMFGGDDDAAEFTASAIFGIASPNGSSHLSGVLNYFKQEAIFYHDRAYTRSPRFLDGSIETVSGNASPGNFQVSRAAAEAAAGRPITEVAASRNTFFAAPPDLTNGTVPASDYRYGRSNSISLFDFSPFPSVQPESERYGGFLNADHKFFGDQLVAYGDVFYQHVFTRYELAPTPTGFFQQPNHTSIAIPPHAPGPTLGGPSYADTGLTMGAYNPFNPFQQILSGLSRFRLAEFGNRISIDETDATAFTIGLKGDRLFNGTWGYDAAFRYSQIETDSDLKAASRSLFNRVLNASDPIFDLASPQYIGSTVPYNPFGDFRRPIASNQASIDFATIHAKNSHASKVATVDLTTYTTALFNLPAGGVGFALGGQFRRESIRQEFDPYFLAGDVTGYGAATFTHAGRKSFGIYSELNVPLFGSPNAIPGFHALEVVGSARFEQYLNNDTNILVPKVGLRWQPFDDTLTLRATWGKGFREPSLFELFNSPAEFFRRTDDPLTGDTNNETPFLLRSNPKLQPEDSRNFTVGLVCSPKFIPGLTLTADYYDIERKDVVGAPDPNEILLREASGTLLPGEAVERDADGTLLRVIGQFYNRANERARGFDFGLQYQITTPLGTFTSLTQASFLESFIFTDVTSGEQFEARSGVAFVFGDAWLKWKGKSRLEWSWKGFDVVTTVTYLDGYHENPPPDFVAEHWVKQTWTFDLQSSYTFAKSAVGEHTESAASKLNAQSTSPWKRLLSDTTITIGCNNIFDRDPPRAYGINQAGYPDYLYNSVGRFVYFKLTKSF